MILSVIIDNSTTYDPCSLSLFKYDEIPCICEENTICFLVRGGGGGSRGIHGVP